MRSFLLEAPNNSRNSLGYRCTSSLEGLEALEADCDSRLLISLYNGGAPRLLDCVGRLPPLALPLINAVFLSDYVVP
jgi:hypothetical protein